MQDQTHFFYRFPSSQEFQAGAQIIQHIGGGPLAFVDIMSRILLYGGQSSVDERWTNQFASAMDWWQHKGFWIAHTPRIPGTLSPRPQVSDPEMHHGTWVTHVPWYIAVSLTSGFLWSWWRMKRSRHYRRMHNPQICLSLKRPMGLLLTCQHKLQSEQEKACCLDPERGFCVAE